MKLLTGAVLTLAGAVLGAGALVAAAVSSRMEGAATFWGIVAFSSVASGCCSSVCPYTLST